MRFLIKLAILGLAAFGAQRLYAELRPQVDDLRNRATVDLHDALDTVKAATDDVKQDVQIAAMQVHDDLATPAHDLKEAAAWSDGNVVTMAINAHDPIVSNTIDVVKRAQRHAVDAARSVDLHEPAEVAKAVATWAARRAAKRTAAATAAATGRAARRASGRASRRVLRVGIGAVAAGLTVGVVVLAIRRMRAAAAPEPDRLAPSSTFGASLDGSAAIDDEPQLPSAAAPASRN